MNPQVLIHLSLGRLLTRFLDGRLSPSEDRKVQEHLAGCSSCARKFRELLTVREALRAIRVQTEGDSTPLPSWAVIERRFGERPLRVPFSARHGLALAGAACVVLALALALVFYNPIPQPPLEVAASRPESADLYQFVGDRLFTPEKVLMGESVIIGTEAEEAMFPERSYFHEKSL